MPHHFSRQFGYPQDVHGMFKKFPRNGTLLEVYKYWNACTRLSTNSIFTILDCDSLEEFSITKAYADCWSKVRFKKTHTHTSTASI